jgi:beta-fructofuranosidase
LPGSPDENGAWSGCAVEHAGKVAFLYTGVAAGPEGLFTQRPCLGWGSDDLETIQHDPHNPLIQPPADLALVGFRDHTVWQEAGGWRMAIGSGVEGDGPLAFLYKSSDLVAWEYLGPLCTWRDVLFRDVGLGNMWECPNFIIVDGQPALIVSACGPDSYGPTLMTGRYTEGRLRDLSACALDYGGTTFYAPQTFYDPSGRCLMFGWMREARPVEAQEAAGWSGAMSLPRQIRFDPGGHPIYNFAPELRSLRLGHHHQSQVSLPQGWSELPSQGRQFELQVELVRGQAARCGLTLLRSPDGAEETRLVIDWQQATLTLDRSKSSLDETCERTAFIAPLPPQDGHVSLHLFLDGSILEVIAQERVALSARLYPTRPDSTGLGWFSEGGSQLAPHLDLYTLASAW